MWREGHKEKEHENEFFSEFINPKVRHWCQGESPDNEPLSLLWGWDTPGGSGVPPHPPQAHLLLLVREN